MPEASTDLTERRRVDLASGARIVVAGSAVGFLTGFFGVGGGFVIVPALVIALRFEMPDAVGTSLLVIALNSAVALSARLAVSGVAWAIAVPFTIAGLAGVTMGTRIADRVPATTLVRWFAALTVVVACYTAIRSATGLLTGPS